MEEEYRKYEISKLQEESEKLELERATHNIAGFIYAVATNRLLKIEEEINKLRIDSL